MNPYEERLVKVFGEWNVRNYEGRLHPKNLKVVLLDPRPEKIALFLLLGFSWNRTPQGSPFWESMRTGALRGDLSFWNKAGKPLLEYILSDEGIPAVEEML